ncbi:MAG: SLC13 family permease [Bacteroidota bacterium]
MKYIKPLLVWSVPILVLTIPIHWIPIEGLTIIQQRVIAIFLFAALSWVFESIPIYATSILIILFELVAISDQSFAPLLAGKESEAFGLLMSYKEIMATFASPIILLFLGGFFLALAATKYRLDQNMAGILLKPFGTSPKMVMLGLMLITAIFSMFMSNTATTAMMLSILAPVLVYFDAGDKGKIAFALSIPMAANIGGMGTPIGTPPNAIALKYLTGENVISFGQWMSFGIPLVVVLLAIAWILLIKMFPIQKRVLELDVKSRFQKGRKATIVYVTFILTILLWLTDFIHGMNAYVVAMIPVGVFLAFNIISKEDIKKLSWDVLWLVSGGIALGLALDKTGLASKLVGTIPFDSLPAIGIMLMATILAVLMANFMSNTATANLLLPIIVALGVSIQSIESLGGAKGLILAVTFSCSLGMALPISTPPNALAHATGMIETKDMARSGIVVASIGLLLIFVMMYILLTVGFI